jgi:hypothetical protein
LSLFTGVIFGVAPAWFAPRTDPAEALRGMGSSIANVVVDKIQQCICVRDVLDDPRTLHLIRA